MWDAARSDWCDVSAGRVFNFPDVIEPNSGQLRWAIGHVAISPDVDQFFAYRFVCRRPMYLLCILLCCILLCIRRSVDLSLAVASSSASSQSRFPSCISIWCPISMACLLGLIIRCPVNVHLFPWLVTANRTATFEVLLVYHMDAFMWYILMYLL